MYPLTVCDVISITHSDESTDNYHPTVQFPSALISNLFPAAAGSCFQLIKALIAYCSSLVQNKPVDKQSSRLAGEHGAALGTSTSGELMVVSIRYPYQLCKLITCHLVLFRWQHSMDANPKLCVCANIYYKKNKKGRRSRIEEGRN